MNSIYNLLISTKNRYNNSVDVDGKELIVNTEITERDAEFVNRIGTVVGLPLTADLPLEVGDEVIIHHNVFRRWYDIHGTEKNGSAYIKEDLYHVALDQIFAYRKDKDWIAAPGYTFVEPIQARIDEWDISKELELCGRLMYKPDHLDLDRGDLVGFRPYSEYEFYIEGKRLYRVYLNDIVWTSKKSEKELLSLRK